jgi:tripartite-type tricarboxylate transporter receptor subunit TctC
VALAATAQAWPDRPIKFIVSAPAGSSLDTLARVVGDKLKDRLGQPVVVENKPAAGGTVATAEVAKSPPDGYTMVLAFNGPLAFGPLLQKLPYDVQKDLAPVIITTNQPNVLVINADLPVKTAAGTGCLRESQSRQTQLRIGGQWQLVASFHGAPEIGGRIRRLARAVQRIAAGGDRHRPG